jgi:ppGpp synthetase/RelA/SpoT-type nucleotidyltranferase
MTPEQLRIQYQDCTSRAERLRDAVVVQLGELLKSNDVSLGVPIESRVKTWASIAEKLDRKHIELVSVLSLQDLIGVRAILLFRSDLERAIELVQSNFEIVSVEDTSRRLSDAEFGYQSQHFILRLPKAWLSLPSLANLDDFFVELQIRTLAQHIWAAASHKLQYKQEAGVPRPLRRTINRVSALLETVDLEFDRVLEERKEYVARAHSVPTEHEPLNVDSLAAVLAELFPPENKTNNESYAELLGDLDALSISTAEQLKATIANHMDKVRESENKRVSEFKDGKGYTSEPDVQERIAQGVFYAHVGLARAALRAEFGDEKVNALYLKHKAKREVRPRKRSS